MLLGVGRLLWDGGRVAVPPPPAEREATGGFPAEVSESLESRRRRAIERARAELGLIQRRRELLPAAKRSDESARLWRQYLNALAELRALEREAAAAHAAALAAEQEDAQRQQVQLIAAGVIVLAADIRKQDDDEAAALALLALH